MAGGATHTRTVFMRFFERSSKLVEARGKTIGLPILRSGVKLDIRGLGARFSGTYLVTSITHTIGEGGYTTEFSARMKKPSATTMLGSGQFSREGRFTFISLISQRQRLTSNFST
jgi:phage protein D